MDLDRSPAPLGWLSDFAWSEGRVVVRKTDVRLRVDYPLIAEIGRWLPYLALLGAAVLGLRLARRGRPTAIWFMPQQPRPWYMARGAALWAGVRMAASPEAAHAAFYFHDVTRGEAPPPPAGLPAFNFRCTDVSKGHVAAVFEEVFGYPLTLDPRTARGPIVEKSQKNGVHDGRIVEAPLEPKEGCVYQRFVDTADEAGVSRDLRTPCVAGAPVVVWVKEKPAGARFAIHNRRAFMREPEDIYSPEELAQIRRFTARMGLDWGGLDILRERASGRLYIVDVNKTDLGPVIALSWGDKVRSMRRLGKALEAMVLRGRPLEDLESRFRSLIADPAFPCVGAKSAMARHDLTVVTAGDIGCPADDRRIHGALTDFAAGYRTRPGPFQSLAILFDSPRRLDETAFEAAMWARLQALADHDAALGLAYDPRVSDDADDPHFSMSFGGEAFFVIGMHPGASRPARRFEVPALVFNPHDQFERLRAEGRYEGLRDCIIGRDVALAGSPNPMLARFGEASEARQYSGRAVGDDWTCPFVAKPRGVQDA